jgi:hypothetical protein
VHIVCGCLEPDVRRRWSVGQVMDALLRVSQGTHPVTYQEDGEPDFVIDNEDGFVDTRLSATGKGVLLRVITWCAVRQCN